MTAWKKHNIQIDTDVSKLINNHVLSFIINKRLSEKEGAVMFDRIKSFFVSTIQTELKQLGYDVSPETLNKALSNAPQLAQQIQTIWASNDPDKLPKIYNLIISAAHETSDASSTTASSSKTKETESDKV